MFVDSRSYGRHRPTGTYPSLGRFVEADPIGYEAGPNLYAYVGNDPINWVDPLGLCPFGQVRVRTGGGSVSGDDGGVTISVDTVCMPIDSVLPRARSPGLSLGDGGGGGFVPCTNQFLCTDPVPPPATNDCNFVNNFCRKKTPVKPAPKPDECDAQCMESKRKIECVMSGFANPQSNLDRDVRQFSFGQQRQHFYRFEGMGQAFMSVWLFNGAKTASQCPNGAL